jgi:hypothetical protein
MKRWPASVKSTTSTVPAQDERERLNPTAGSRKSERRISPEAGEISDRVGNQMPGVSVQMS